MITKSKIRNFFLILALVAVSTLAGYRLGERRGMAELSQGKGNQLDLTMMWRVKSRLEKLFLEKDKMVDKEMEYGAIGGMVESLGDPYTVYLPPKDNKSANEDLAGEFGGVGISLGYKDKTLAVMTPLAQTPAEKAGILAGDLILKIIDRVNKVDRDTSGISLTEAVELIRGKIGSQVTLKLFREGMEETFDVTLTRENIVVPSIELKWKEKDGRQIAWIRLYKFTDRLYQEWNEVADKIVSEKKGGKVAGVVLDLRNNPGGFLQASVMAASDFLKDGVVVSQESSDGTKEDYFVDKTLGRLADDRLVVLVNGGSASAAEILAGALKEYQRAKIVGEKTFGKGTVQQPEDFSDGSGLHVTIARWLLPNGVNIHQVGVEPDVEVKYEVPKPVPTGTVTKTELPDNQLDKAIEVLLKG